MQTRFRRRPAPHALVALALASSLTGGGSAAAAENDLTVHAGLRFGGDLDSEGIDIDALDVAPAFGLTWDHELRERRVVWTSWSWQPTDAEAPGLLPDRDSIDLDVHYLHAGTAYRGKAGDGLQGFVLFGLGLTWIDPAREFDAELGGSVVIGGGFRVPLRPAVAFRFDARGYATFTDIDLSGECGGVPCTIDFAGTGPLQVDVSSGFSFAF